ncbi:Type II toxin-antitoxin system HicA family toxin [Candidatus Magnetomoraceae bacterium gMMP-1]
MPKKIRELIAKLRKNGFIDRGGKGSHRNFIHKQGIKLTLSGKNGNDAKPYQEKDVKEAILKVLK